MERGMGKGVESLYPFPFNPAPSSLPFFPVTLSSSISWEPFRACGV